MLLLIIKSLVFNLPAQSSSLVRQFGDVALAWAQIGKPGEVPGYRLSIFDGVFFTENGVQCVSGILQVGAPPESLCGVLVGMMYLLIAGTVFELALSVFPKRWYLLRGKGDKEAPVVFSGDGQDLPAGIQ